MKVYDLDTDRIIDSKLKQAVDKLLLLKKQNGSNPWPAIELCIKIWIDKHPQRWKSHLIDIKDIRETRKDPKFASTYDKKHGGYLRYTLDIPQEIIFYIRKLYSNEELPMNRAFFLEFAKRFPIFKVAQKL